MDKIVDIDGRLVSKRLGSIEPTVQVLHLGQRNGHTKTASEASEWAKSVKPQPGKTYILVLALGASEWYGPNRNGDGFSEDWLRKKYKTFETDATVFRSHVNKDPAKGFGKVVKSFYNEDMHRVELVLEIDNDKAPDIVEKINNGEQVAVSMGCRIKWDVCSICSNKAPKRDDYCDHAKFQLNDILPDGRIVFVDNPDPTFFDISVVWRPADRTGYMLKKVAYDQSLPFVGSSAEQAEKVAARTVLASILRKVADIDKIVSGVGFGTTQDSSLTGQWTSKVVPKVLANYKSIDNADLGWLSGKNFPRVLATLSEMGIFLATPEFLDMFFLKATGKPATPGLASKLISVQGDLFNMMADNPCVVESLLNTGVLGDESTETLPDVAEKMSAYLPHRGWAESGLRKLAYDPLASSYRDPFVGGRMETKSYTDPRTGKTYVTSGDAIYSGEQEAARDNAASLLGAAALAATTYLALAPFVHSKVLRAMPAGLMGAFFAARTRSPEVRLDSGEMAPAIAAFTERRAEWAPQLSTSLAANYARMSGPRTRKTHAQALCKTASLVGDEINLDTLTNSLGYLLASN